VTGSLCVGVRISGNRRSAGLKDGRRRRCSSEFVFWQEFTTRFNFIAVDYLVYTQEVIGNIRQSYPVRAILSAIAVAALAIVLLTRRYLRLSTAPLGARRRLVYAGLAVALPAVGVAVANVDQMNESGNAYSDELSGNGLLSLAAAFRRNELGYDRFYCAIPPALADAILRALGVERERLSDALKPDETEDTVAKLGPLMRRPRNVVLISVKSLTDEAIAYYQSASRAFRMGRLRSPDYRAH
jgi:hypothetical protein